MESWRSVWRAGFGKLLPVDGLQALRRALETDDADLLQGCTTRPPALNCTQDWPVDGCCAVSYTYWKGEHLRSVGNIGQAFSKACFETDRLIDEESGCRFFLRWFDDTPREEMRRELLAEVDITLMERCHGS